MSSSSSSNSKRVNMPKPKPTARKPRRSLLSRFLSVAQPSSKSVRTSGLSLTSAEEDDAVLCSFQRSTKTENDTIGNDNNTFPTEVQVVRDIQEVQDQWSFDDDNDDESNDDNDDDDDDDDYAKSCTEPSTAAQYYDQAVAYAVREYFDECLCHVALGLEACNNHEHDSDDEHDNYEDDGDDDDAHHSVRWMLCQLQADIWGRTGRVEESLEAYQRILQHSLGQQQQQQHPNNHSPPTADQANMLYACGKLSVRLCRYEEALEYYQRELKVTRAVTSGHARLAVARIHHEMARVSKEGMGDSEQALGYYKQAHAVERLVYQSLQVAVQECSSCRCCSNGKQTVHCVTHESRTQEVAQQMQDTKRNMGRIHFELGDLDQAVRLSLRHIV